MVQRDAEGIADAGFIFGMRLFLAMLHVQGNCLRIGHVEFGGMHFLRTALAGLGVQSGESDVKAQPLALEFNLNAEASHHVFELLDVPEVILHSLLHNLLNLMSIVPFLGVKLLVADAFRDDCIFRDAFRRRVVLQPFLKEFRVQEMSGRLGGKCLPVYIGFLLLALTDSETVLCCQFLHERLAAPFFIGIVDFLPFLVHTDRHYVIMHATCIHVLVNDVGLVPVAQPCHQFLGKFHDLLLAYPVGVRRIDGHVKRRFLTTQAPTLVALQRFYWVVRIIYIGHIQDGGHSPFYL